jgi:hypothetical protein
MPSPDLQCLSYVLTLAGFGGEEEEGKSFSTAGSRRWRWELVEYVSPAAILMSSFGHHYPWPRGFLLPHPWPHARERSLLKFVLPSSQDLLQPRVGIKRSYYPKWLCPRRWLGQPCSEAALIWQRDWTWSCFAMSCMVLCVEAKNYAIIFFFLRSYL